jgi:bla regulator protein BlaR1
MISMEIKRRNKMIKKLKKGSYKSSINILLASVLATTAVFMNNSVIAKSIEVNKVITATSSNEGVNNFIIDSPVKCYNDLKKVQKIIDFKFKLPDFLPSGNSAGYIQIRKLSEKDNVLEAFFQNKKGSFSFVISERDPVEILQKIEGDKIKAINNSKVEVKKEPLKIGDIKGLKVTLTTTLSPRLISNVYSKVSEKNSEYFVWRDENIWYSLEYNSASISEETCTQEVSLSQDNIVKIAKSIKAPEEIKNVDYEENRKKIEENVLLNIYDKEDLEKARSLLGYNPKFPVKINNDINITSSVLRRSVDVDKKNNRENYEINNFYSNKDGSIIFIEQNNSELYDKLFKGEIQSIKAEKLNINNNEVYKYFNNAAVSEVNYLWKENNIYYAVTFYVNTDNSNEIVKEFVNSKPIDCNDQ